MLARESKVATTISGWGRYPVLHTELSCPRTADAVRQATLQADHAVARGNGRAYGDAAVGGRQTISMSHLNRIRSFDPRARLVTAEAGLLLSDLIDTFLPRGLFPYVVPGTSFVTVGGAIAADVHGKNHHREGGFGAYVESMVLVLATGEAIRVSRDEHPELFRATIGGMGLTGMILEATIRLRPLETGWISQRTIVADNLSAAFAALESSDSATYSVAWIDCLARGSRLGRSLVFVGEHATSNELDGKLLKTPFPPRKAPISIPIDAPSFVLNHWTVAAFNKLYFRAGARNAGSPVLVPAHPYFFPLDALGNWNRIYGRRGFLQHQSVIPTRTAQGTLAEMLDRIARRGGPSFLAVLKKLGQGTGLMSFPMPGYTLALDFPLERDLLTFLDELDELVVAAGGKIYLAKDARQSRATFEAGYPDFLKLRDIRRSIDRTEKIKSRLAERIGI